MRQSSEGILFGVKNTRSELLCYSRFIFSLPERPNSTPSIIFLNILNHPRVKKKNTPYQSSLESWDPLSDLPVINEREEWNRQVGRGSNLINQHHQTPTLPTLSSRDSLGTTTCCRPIFSEEYHSVILAQSRGATNSSQSSMWQGSTAPCDNS